MAEAWEGNPSSWSTSDLKAWLNDPAWSDAPRSKLVEEVTRRLDELYRTYTPTYPNVTANIDIQPLVPWESMVDRAPDPDAILDGAQLPTELLAQLRLHQSRSTTPGPLEHCFNASYALHEKVENLGKALDMGRHPLDDFRQNQLLITRAFDTGAAAGVNMQDIDQQEAMSLRVVGVRFLPPGQKLRAGDKVVCHNLHGQGKLLQHLNGLTAIVVSAKHAAGTYTLDVDVATGGAPASEASRKVVRCSPCVHARQGMCRLPCCPAAGCWLLPACMFASSVGAHGSGHSAAGSWTTSRLTGRLLLLQAGVPAWALLVVEGDDGADPKAKDMVVLRGLKNRAELNGRFGQVLAVVNPGNEDAKRCAAGGDAFGWGTATPQHSHVVATKQLFAHAKPRTQLADGFSCCTSGHDDWTSRSPGRSQLPWFSCVPGLLSPALLHRRDTPLCTVPADVVHPVGWAVCAALSLSTRTWVVKQETWVHL
jgi:hypothetical protein